MTIGDGAYEIVAQWDGEAGVWVAECDDVPGLIAKAASPNELVEKLRVLIPELLELNNVALARPRFLVSYQNMASEVLVY